jgi:hypothetical protein
LYFYGLKGSGETGKNLLSYDNICKEREVFKDLFAAAAQPYTDLYVLIPYAQILPVAQAGLHATCGAVAEDMPASAASALTTIKARAASIRPLLTGPR